jgi:Flp pilus assembly protein TadG
MHRTHWGRLARLNRRGRGQATVEFALTIGIVLVLFFAVVDFGRMVAIHTATVTASREAARYGSAVGDNGSGTPRFADCVGIRQAARNVTGAMVTLTDNQIAVSYDDGAGGSTGADPCPVGPGPTPNPAAIERLNRVVVQVTATYEAISPVRFLIGPVTVVSTDRRTIVKP